MTTQVRKTSWICLSMARAVAFTIATTNLLPNVVMAFVIQALKITGLLDWVGHICEPVMALWGLPGEAATVLFSRIDEHGRRSRCCRQSGNRWRINRPRCHRFTAPRCI